MLYSGSIAPEGLYIGVCKYVVGEWLMHVTKVNDGESVNDNIKPVHVFGYVRVSTNLQDPEMQIKAIRKECEEKGYTLVRIYKDIRSGKDNSRKEYVEMMEALKNKEYGVKTLLIWKLDRLSRSQKELINDLDFFKINEIDFISITEGLDTHTKMGEFMFSFLAMISEFEHSLIKERVQAGIENYIENGGKLGRPKKVLDMNRVKQDIRYKIPKTEIAKKHGVSLRTLYNNLNDPSNVLPVDPKQLVELRAKGWSIRKISEEFGITSARVYEMLEKAQIEMLEELRG